MSVQLEHSTRVFYNQKINKHKNSSSFNNRADTHHPDVIVLIQNKISAIFDYSLKTNTVNKYSDKMYIDAHTLW